MTTNFSLSIIYSHILHPLLLLSTENYGENKEYRRKFGKNLVFHGALTGGRDGGNGGGERLARINMKEDRGLGGGWNVLLSQNKIVAFSFNLTIVNKQQKLLK